MIPFSPCRCYGNRRIQQRSSQKCPIRVWKRSFRGRRRHRQILSIHNKKLLKSFNFYLFPSALANISILLMNRSELCFEFVFVKLIRDLDLSFKLQGINSTAEVSKLQDTFFLETMGMKKAQLLKLRGACRCSNFSYTLIIYLVFCVF